MNKCYHVFCPKNFFKQLHCLKLRCYWTVAVDQSRIRRCHTIISLDALIIKSRGLIQRTEYLIWLVDKKNLIHSCEPVWVTKWYKMIIQNLIGINLILLTNFHFISNEIQLRGKGASFPSEVYKAWMPSYKANRQNQVSLSMEYLAVGSGNGQKAIINNIDIEYAGSDSNLPESTKTLYPDLIEFPTIAG